MRRVLGVTASAVLVATALSGCGNPPGTDGDLTDDWRPVAEARQFAPRAGECHVNAEPTAYLTSHQPVDCAKAHLVETFHIGTFTGDLAARPIPPRVGSAAMRSAFTECDAKAKEFVGGDWRDGRLTVQVAPTSPAGWAGGSRWYRCDLFELNPLDDTGDAAVNRAGSLRGALRASTPLRHGCAEAGEWGHLLTVPCTKVHRYEYVGVWMAPNASYEDATKDEDAVHTKCRSVIARYAKVPVDRMLRYRTGSTYRFPSEEAWARGDRGVRCWYWSSGKKLTRSIAGGGTKALPVN
ncbi:septum formation family protein [Micromonospora peucetia]|nr:septum formation family protein [Micromonospora peucetia]